MEKDASELRFRQLDALRAFAVLAVVACHTLDPVHQSWSSYGRYGVQLFFVISGFLITGILIDARRGAALVRQPQRQVLRAFYARRVLRIFPVYYLTLLLCTLIGVVGMRAQLGWNLLYLSNWQMAIDRSWGGAPHLWSLAVEEQFYLLWPLVVLLAPRRVLPWAIGAMVATALVTRTLLLHVANVWPDGVWILTPSVLDSLGLGALLALLWRVSPRVDRIVAWIGALAVGLLACTIGVHLLAPSTQDLAAVTDIWWALLFVWIVHHVARGTHGAMGKVLTWRPILYVGMVSYGVYLFHLLVLPSVWLLGRDMGVDLPMPAKGVGRFVVVTGFSIALAGLSWTHFERPINEQKHRFPYVRTNGADEPRVVRFSLRGRPAPP
ncbi:MAG TPA: acyltransferase [Acidimicrobiales bacterium]|nr:acyltransferase [Acidimicrobiales bacterium]